MQLDQLINRINTLPTIPMVLLKLNDILKDPRTTMTQIADVISKDQTCAARVLRLVNSAYYSLPRKITNLKEAVVWIGINPLRHLLLATTVFDLIPINNKGGKLNREQFWYHTIGCSVASRVIGQFSSMANPEELFAAGLLHDIGKVALDYLLHDEFVQAVDLAHNEKIHIAKAERRIFGFDHSIVGGLLAEKWHFPSKIQTCIKYHHQPFRNNKYPKEVAIIHLADILVRAKNLGTGYDNTIPEISMEAWDCIGLPLISIKPIIKQVETDFTESVSIFMSPIFTQTQLQPHIISSSP